MDRNLLAAGAARLGVPLDAVQLEQMAAFVALLYEWNARLNLTRVPREEVVARHLLDSLAVCAVAGSPAPRTLIDLGTGAGLPGVPLAVAWPACRVTLLDSTRKRLDFVDAALRTLRLPHARTVHARAEEAARTPQHRERYDLVVARAVAPMPLLAGLLLPFARIGGAAVALKSSGADTEIQGARDRIGALGGTLERVVEVPIPGADVRRLLAVLRKERPTPGPARARPAARRAARRA
ncbi:MAG: 16S rRNA (guanine(527)-N(7))-methyltransferase RsmG [Chthonomonadales bacterium]|nr:16S rRNA (guanine(527)-N(7))-methyltransferase RsmG [Chthonomonadales bacterium]